MEFVQVEVKERKEMGKGPVRRLRREGMVPAVLYGLGRRNLPLTISDKEVQRFLRTGSHLIGLKMGDAMRQAIIREVQHDAITDEILHIDFHRVDEDALLEAHVLIEYKGEAVGTREGGVFQALMEQIHVSARPADLPRVIVIEIEGLKVGDAIRLEDVKLPSGVTAVGEADALVAQCQMPKVAADEGDDEEGEEGADA